MKRRKSMSKQILTVAAVLLLTTLAPQSHATPTTQAKIPFAFEVNNTTMPAGQYEVTRVFDGSGAGQLIRGTHSGGGVFLPTMSLHYTERNAEPKLVFHCYGRECFLSEVWSGDGRAWKLTESHREKEVSQINAENDLASIAVPLSVKQ
jgi:hypothetical protein